MSKPKFNYRWKLASGYPAPGVKSHQAKVFSLFSCGGGSTMGYKLAGFDVLGCCEIDPRIIKVYRANHNPKYSFCMDIRDFNKLPEDEIPDELKNLDLLDGSPPCSVFSTAGLREKVWDKEKKFAEGQKKQKLDDLFLHFIETAKRLGPKIIVSENVSGLIKGKAKGYVIEIFKGFENIGYDTQLFLLNGATMGLPQARSRVFFISRRKDLNLPKLHLKFDFPSIPFKEIRNDDIPGRPLTDYEQHIWNHRQPGDLSFSKAVDRLENRLGYFSYLFIKNKYPVPTLLSGAEGEFVLYDIPRKINREEVTLASSFPLDYDFGSVQSSFLCGMSVPPIMTANIADQIYEQWLSKL